MNDIIIEVQDGMVCNVYSNSKDVIVRVLDWDSDEEKNQYNKYLRKQTKTMNHVWEG